MVSDYGFLSRYTPYVTTKILKRIADGTLTIVGTVPVQINFGTRNQIRRVVYLLEPGLFLC